MGYWGWRSLGAGVISALFISVWVVGCTLVDSPAATLVYTPVFTPEITLTVGRLGIPPSNTASLPTLALASPSASPAAGSPASGSPASGSPTPPAPTATPIRYVIVPGDTLLDLALRYDVPLDALRAANADSSGLLQIGQVILIPPTQAATDATQPVASVAGEPTPTPLALRVDAPTCYPVVGAGAGERSLCLGRVFNSTQALAGYITLRLNPDAPPFLVEQPLIAPGAFAAYAVLVTTAAGAGALPPALTLVSADAADETAFALLTVAEPTFAPLAAGRVTVSAQIANEGAGAVRSIDVYIMLLDDEARVIGYRVVTLEDGLTAGGRLPFSAEIALLGHASPSTLLITAIGRTGLL